MNRLLIIIVAASLYSSQTQAQTKHEIIKTNLKKMEALIGHWELTTENISHSGKRSEETGKYHFYWELDSTYIVRKGSITNNATNRTRKFISWLTYDTSVDKYKMVFFYDRRANQIIEYGTLDETTKTFTTYTSFEIEDGVTEYIRHVVNFNDPNRMVGRSWIKLDEGEEANNFTEILTRK